MDRDGHMVLSGERKFACHSFGNSPGRREVSDLVDAALSQSLSQTLSPSLCVYLTLSLPLSLSLSLSLWMSVCLSYLPLPPSLCGYIVTLCLSLRVCVCDSLSLSLSPCVCLSVCLSISLSLSLPLSPFLCFSVCPPPPSLSLSLLREESGMAREGVEGVAETLTSAARFLLHHRMMAIILFH